MTAELARPFDLGPMPLGRRMQTVDERLVRSPVGPAFELASKVENWPSHLPHYRYVRFRERRSDGGGIVEMSADRPFHPSVAGKTVLSVNWPTWWLSEMSVDAKRPAIRFRHIGGITKGMEVEWTFVAVPAGTHVRIVHLWDGPGIPLVGTLAATRIIGPVFVHGIASRTLAGLAEIAEREARTQL
ncbi:MAG TPA: SRPBCC family protein [Gemmatimonadaceae bacterium]|nr:SRPBCC family protein [Gemmatimonadaceae bacterium]